MKDIELCKLIHHYRRQLVKDRLDDAEYNLCKWRFGMRPSEIRKQEVKIENLKEKLRKLDRR